MGKAASKSAITVPLYKSGSVLVHTSVIGGSSISSLSAMPATAKSTITPNIPDPEGTTCVQCKTRPREVRLERCNHTVLCDNCVWGIVFGGDSVCPVCKERIEVNDVVQVPPAPT